MSPRDKEAEVIAKYLIGVQPTAASQELYRQAVGILTMRLPDRWQRVWDYVLAHSWLLPYVDAGLAWSEPRHFIRQRIHIMFAILETQPDYARFFIHKKTDQWLIPAAAYSLRALWRAGAGFVAIKLMILL